MQTKEDKVELLKFLIRQRKGIACVKYTQQQWLIEALKIDWLTNFEAQALVKSSSGDRRLREIAENPPEGYRLQRRLKDCPVRCLEFHLTMSDQLDLFEVA